MNPEFNLTGTELIFLAAAVLVTLPILIFAKWILRELKKDNE